MFPIQKVHDRNIVLKRNLVKVTTLPFRTFLLILDYRSEIIIEAYHSKFIEYKRPEF